jgi:hypothetical protein
VASGSFLRTHGAPEGMLVSAMSPADPHPASYAAIHALSDGTLSAQRLARLVAAAPLSEHNRFAVGRFIEALRRRGDTACFVLDDCDGATYSVEVDGWQAFTDVTVLPLNFSDDLIVVSETGDLVFILFHHDRLELMAWDGSAATWLAALQVAGG